MKSNVTPYMHVMVYHLPHAMRLHGGIKKFTGQGMFVINMTTKQLKSADAVYNICIYCGLIPQNYSY